MDVSRKNDDWGRQMPEHSDTQIRVLVVEDHVILRQCICSRLNTEDDFKVVGEVGNEKTAGTLTIELQPDIVLLDLGLGGSRGLEVAQQFVTNTIIWRFWEAISVVHVKM